MPRAVSEVHVGPGWLYTADEGTAFPADPATAPAVDWVEIGYSTEGWNFVVDRTFERVLAAEEIDPLLTFKTAQEIHVRGTLLQNSLENLLLALGGGEITTDAGPPATRTYSPPATTEFTAFAVLLRVEAEQSATVGTEMRDFQFQKTVSVGAIDMPHNKAPNASVIAIDFEAQVPSAGDIFNIVELT